MAKTGRIEVEIVAKTAKPESETVELRITLGNLGFSGPVSLPENARELLFWWLTTAADDAQRTIPKMFEYGGGADGSADLQLMGENLATLLDMHDAPDSVKQEMACWFYLQGKIARLVSDYKAHRPGKGDTWFDAEVYAKMARRIQETGQWP